jgi:hypothetical protein
MPIVTMRSARVRSATRLTGDVRDGLRKMLREVHRVVQKPDELHGARGADPVEEDVTRGSSALADVERANAWANVVARLAALRVAGDGRESVLNQDGVLASLIDAPSLLRVLERLDDVSRFARGERITSAMREGVKT